MHSRHLLAASTLRLCKLMGYAIIPFMDPKLQHLAWHKAFDLTMEDMLWTRLTLSCLQLFQV